MSETEDAIQGFINPFTIDEKVPLCCSLSGACIPTVTTRVIFWLQRPKVRKLRKHLSERVGNAWKHIWPNLYVNRLSDRLCPCFFSYRWWCAQFDCKPTLACSSFCSRYYDFCKPSIRGCFPAKITLISPLTDSYFAFVQPTLSDIHFVGIFCLHVQWCLTIRLSG